MRYKFITGIISSGYLLFFFWLNKLIKINTYEILILITGGGIFSLFIYSFIEKFFSIKYQKNYRLLSILFLLFNTILLLCLNLLKKTQYIIFLSVLAAIGIYIGFYVIYKMSITILRREDNSYKGYKIYENYEFIIEIRKFFKQAIRTGYNAGIIFISYNIEGVNLTKNEESFIRKQLAFTLTEKTREYEPVGRFKEKNVFIKVFLVRDKEEFTKALERIKAVLKSSEFIIYDYVLKPDFIYRGIYIRLKKKIFTDRQLETNIIKLLNQGKELLHKRSKEIIIHEW